MRTVPTIRLFCLLELLEKRKEYNLEFNEAFNSKYEQLFLLKKQN